VLSLQPRREFLETWPPTRDNNEVITVSGQAFGERLTDSS
jgi:hypothetical protein